MKRVDFKNRLRVAAFALSCAIMLGAAAGCKDNNDPEEKEVPSYVVTFDSKGGAPTPPAQTVKEGEKVAKPADPEKLGFTFVGWAKADNETSALWNFDTETVADAMVLYARWIEGPGFTVSFNAKGGTPTPPDQILKAGDKVSKPTDPELEGFLLTGWAKEDNATSALWNFDTETVTADMTLYARWTEANFVINLIAPLDDITVDLNDEETFPVTFSWTKATGVEGYTIKISNDPSFAEDATYTINVGNESEFTMNAEAGKTVLNFFTNLIGFDKSRKISSSLYWTVTPTVQNALIENKIQSFETFPASLGKRAAAMNGCVGLWEFNDASNLEKATIGKNLVGYQTTVNFTLGSPSTAGFSQGAGFYEKDRACVIQTGPNYFHCDHGIPPTTDNGFVGEYTIVFDMTVFDVWMGIIDFKLTNEFGPWVCLRGPDLALQSNSNLGKTSRGWNTLLITLKADQFYRAYENGIKIIEGTPTWRDDVKLRPEGVFFFLNDNVVARQGFSVSSIAIFNRALSEDEIKSLGYCN